MRSREIDGGPAFEVRAAGPVGLAGGRAPPGRLEGFRRLFGERGRPPAFELGDQRRGLVEVIGTDLEQLLAGPLAQPAGETLMEVCPRRLGETRVRHLAD